MHPKNLPKILTNSSYDSQKGTVPLLILIAFVGIIGFLAVTQLTSFKHKTLALLFPSKYSYAASATDWAQIQKDPQHTGFSSENLGLNFKTAWTHPFQPERVNPQVQAIIYSNIVFIGTENGKLYAFDGGNGATIWTFIAGGPIVNSVAVDNGKVYLATLDGSIYGLNVADGSQVWKINPSFRHGFSTAPIIADNKLIIGGRDGILYAFDLSNGNKLWEYKTGAPILMTPAWDSGKAYFGTMDMFIYAVNSADGSLAWKSAKINGASFRQYWPVVTQGKVVVIAEGKLATNNNGVKPAFPFTWFSTANDWSWLTTNGPTVASGQLSSIAQANTAQDSALSAYAANPPKYIPLATVLDAGTGQNAGPIIFDDVLSHNGPKPPPCVDRDGKLIMPLNFIKTGWGRLDLAQRKFVDVLYDGFDINGQPMAASKSPAGFGNEDENVMVSCANNMVLAFHIQEGNAQYTGVFEQNYRRWIHLNAGYISGQQFNNTQSGGANPASISNGKIYHVTVNELVVRSTN